MMSVSIMGSIPSMDDRSFGECVRISPRNHPGNHEQTTLKQLVLYTYQLVSTLINLFCIELQNLYRSPTII